METNLDLLKILEISEKQTKINYMFYERFTKEYWKVNITILKFQT